MKTNSANSLSDHRADSRQVIMIVHTALKLNQFSAGHKEAKVCANAHLSNRTKQGCNGKLNPIEALLEHQTFILSQVQYLPII